MTEQVVKSEDLKRRGRGRERERERERERKRNVSFYVVQLKPVPKILFSEGELIKFRF